MLKNVYMLFRSLNNYVFKFLEYIERKNAIKAIIEQYNISNDTIEIINNAILVFCYLCIFLLIKTIVEKLIGFVIKEANKGSEEYIVGDETQNNKEMSYQDTQELDSEYIRKMVEESQKNKKEL